MVDIETKCIFEEIDFCECIGEFEDEYVEYLSGMSVEV